MGTFCSPAGSCMGTASPINKGTKDQRENGNWGEKLRGSAFQIMGSRRWQNRLAKLLVGCFPQKYSKYSISSIITHFPHNYLFSSNKFSYQNHFWQATGNEILTVIWIPDKNKVKVLHYIEHELFLLNDIDLYACKKAVGFHLCNLAVYAIFAMNNICLWFFRSLLLSLCRDCQKCQFN